MGIFGCGCLSVVLVALIIGGGYLSLRQGWLSQRQIIALMGQGPGDVGVANLAEELLDVSVNALGQRSAGYTVLEDQSLEPGDLTGYVLEAGRFTIHFSSPSGALNSACTIQVRSDDEYQFLADTTGIYITRKGDNSQSGLLVSESGLCQP